MADDMKDEADSAADETAFLGGNSDRLVELRLKALDLAVRIASAPGGKPHHAPYIAGDIYRFLLTGKKPAGPPPRDRGKAEPPAEK